MARLFLLLSFFITTSVFAFSNCPLAVSTSDAGFCASFKKVAICHCAESVPEFFCRDMDSIYKRMVAYFGSLERACAHQKETDKQTCIDDWNCYRNGGKDSKGLLCSASGNVCPVN